VEVSISTTRSRISREQALGWSAVVLSALISGFWAFWGIVENFHEGWYLPSLLDNLGLMLLQYLSPMLIFVALSFLAIRWPILGLSAYGALALFVVGFFGGFTEVTLYFLVLPLLLLGVLFWKGRPQPRQRAYIVLAGVPLVVLLALGIEPAVRVAQRVDDGNLGMRVVRGNGVSLAWAPEGPGWPERPMPWDEARRVCEHLVEDGSSLSPEVQHIWRLPTADEAVRSMARHGVNAQGQWDSSLARARYSEQPDKESPLWNVHSPIIYWWTATEADSSSAYIIVYDGKVWPKLKRQWMGCRCVKEAPGQ
jgi:hypothetical protein